MGKFSSLLNNLIAEEQATPSPEPIKQPVSLPGYKAADLPAIAEMYESIHLDRIAAWEAGLADRKRNASDGRSRERV
jgi:hypothetical protein